MKKIIILVICILILLSGTALARVDKTLSPNRIELKNEYQSNLNNTDMITVSLIREGIFEKMLGIEKRGTANYLILFLAPTVYPYTSTEVTFTTRSIPFISTFNKEVENKLTLRIGSISNNLISYELNNKNLHNIATAEKVNLVLPLKNGSIQTIEIPEETLKDWRFIVTCNLWDEFKKGI